MTARFLSAGVPSPTAASTLVAPLAPVLLSRLRVGAGSSLLRVLITRHLLTTMRIFLPCLLPTLALVVWLLVEVATAALVAVVPLVEATMLAVAQVLVSTQMPDLNSFHFAHNH